MPRPIRRRPWDLRQVARDIGGGMPATSAVAEPAGSRSGPAGLRSRRPVRVLAAARAGGGASAGWLHWGAAERPGCSGRRFHDLGELAVLQAGLASDRRGQRPRGRGRPGWSVAAPTGSAHRSTRAGPRSRPCVPRGYSNVVPLLLCFPWFRAQRRPAVVAGTATQGRRCR